MEKKTKRKRKTKKNGLTFAKTSKVFQASVYILSILAIAGLVSGLSLLVPAIALKVLVGVGAIALIFLAGIWYGFSQKNQASGNSNEDDE